MDEEKEYENQINQEIKSQKRLNSTKIIIQISGIFAIAGFILSIFFISGMTGYVVGEEIKSNYFSLVFLAFVLGCWVVSVLYFSFLNRQKRKEKIDIEKLIATRGWTSILPLEYNEKT